MAVVGVDSLSAVSPDLIKTVADRLGATPVFWGRYFKGPGNPDQGQFHAQAESAALRDKRIHVLPIARQTNRVNGTHEQGREDGVGNARAIIEAFGEEHLNGRAARVLVYLDVEGRGDRGGVELSEQYYRGWSAGLASVSAQLVGAVYGPAPKGHPETYQALAHAIAAGAECKGVWVARYPHNEFTTVPAWSEDENIRSPHLPANCPLLGWQFVQNVDQAFDVSVVNPSFESQFIDGLVRLHDEPTAAPAPAPAAPADAPGRQDAPAPTSRQQPPAPSPSPAPGNGGGAFALFLALIEFIMKLFGSAPSRQASAPPAGAPPVPTPDDLKPLLRPMRRAPLPSDFERLANALNCESAALEAAAEVEALSSAFQGDEGFPTTYFDPQTFSELTRGAYDRSHRHLSDPGWRARANDLRFENRSRYPLAQAARWRQVCEAYALCKASGPDGEAALRATRWGAYGFSGAEFRDFGHASALDFVSALCVSEAAMLESFVAVIRRKGLGGALARRNWQAFVTGYHGAAAPPEFAQRIAAVYARHVVPAPPPAQRPPVQAITLDEYYMGHRANYGAELDPAKEAHAAETVERVNKLLEFAAADGILVGVNPESHSRVNSGWRPAAVNARTPNAAPRSLHISCQACDLNDPEGELDDWCMNNQGKLEAAELWFEHPSATKTWCHLQIIPPPSLRRAASGSRRWFYP